MLFLAGNSPKTYLVIVGGLFTLWSYLHSFAYLSQPDPQEDVLDDLPADQSAIMNSTLGFQKIFVLNMPARTDRKESMIATMEAGPRLTFSWRDGVRGEDVTSPPKTWDVKKHTLGLLGSYQAHMNILQEIIDKNIETALILEDDITWDIFLRYQLIDFGRALASLNDGNVTLKAPYGTDWDALWLGTCANPPGPPNSVVYNSIITDRATWVWDIDGGASCTYAYAVTREGCKRIVETMQDINQGYDLQLSTHCKSNRCPLIWPPLFEAKELGSDIDAARNTTRA